MSKTPEKYIKLKRNSRIDVIKDPVSGLDFN